MEMTARPMNRKPTRLRSLFMKYLMFFCAGIILLGLLLGGLFIAMLSWGAILPANYAEKQVAAAAASFGQEGTVPSSEDALFRYALLSSNGEWTAGTLSPRDASQAWTELKERTGITSLTHVYVKAVHQDQVMLFRYSVSAQFEPLWLRNVIPSAEIAFFAAFLGLLIAGVLWLASAFGRTLSLKLKGLRQAAEHVQNQDLDFEIRMSGVSEIDQILDSMHQMKEALRSSLQQQWKLEQSRREQISALAHDVKTPLTIVRGNVELLSETGQSAEQQEYTAYITDSVRQMEQYIRTLIDIANTETSMSLNRREVDAHRFVERVKGQVQALIAVKKQHVVWAVSSFAPRFYADEDLLERALMNVVHNASDHMAEHQQMTIRIDAAGQGLRWTVIDEGSGFSAEALKYATDQFYMGDASRSSTGHYGMGLYISQHIMQMHGGKLRLGNSEETGGAQVTLEIPVGAKR